jgi:hypothetical protein
MNINQLNAIVEQADNNPRGLISWIMDWAAEQLNLTFLPGAQIV